MPCLTLRTRGFGKQFTIDSGVGVKLALMTFYGVCFVYEQMYEGKRLKFDNRALYYPASTTLPADPAHRAEEGRLWGRIMSDNLATIVKQPAHTGRIVAMIVDHSIAVEPRTC